MDWIRKRRKELNLSQEELASRLQLLGQNVGRGSVGHWETGYAKPQVENPELVKALSNALELDVNTVLRLSGYNVVSRYSETAERVANIVTELPSEKQELALRLVEQLAKNQG